MTRFANGLHFPQVCEITYARVQGRQALVDHFRNSKFPCQDKDSLPLVFEPAKRNKVGGGGSLRMSRVMRCSTH